jgi:ferredoxin
MKINGKTVLLCDCGESAPINVKALTKGLESETPPRLCHELCRSEMGIFGDALSNNEALLIGCTQESPLFEELRDEEAPEAKLSFVNLRETAGWSVDAGKSAPKMAGLLAEAALNLPSVSSITITSEGRLVILGRTQEALETAAELADRLDVILLLDRQEEIVPPPIAEVPVFAGRVRAAQGRLGAFRLIIDKYAPLLPTGRDTLCFAKASDGVEIEADIILDLTGNPPIFPGHLPRAGYLSAAPGDKAGLARAIFAAADLVGEFEKPRFIKAEPKLCAHKRNEKIGCRRCLDLCCTGATAPDGDHVEVDPAICLGCGDCAGACPTGALSYTMPGPNSLLERLRVLISTYHRAGGHAPVILVHDREHGFPLIALAARFGKGLPAHVLPFAIERAPQTGIDFLAAGLAYGASAILYLAPKSRYPHAEGLAEQITLANAIAEGLGLGSERARMLDLEDPEKLLEILWAVPPKEFQLKPALFKLRGSKRERTMLSLRHLHTEAKNGVEFLPLPEGSPFGKVLIDGELCTLCLSCVGACPTQALSDFADSPRLLFTEEKCIQCGLCLKTCPEKAVTLKVGISFAPEARTPVLLKEDEPFCCPSCGKPFGTKKSVEATILRLKDHPNFAKIPGMSVDHLRLCEDCRVIAIAETSNDPLTFAPRPKPRTTDDYR